MKVKKIGLTAQLLVVISLLLLILNSVQGYILVNQSKAAMKAQIRERMLDISDTAAAMLDGDSIASLMPGDEDTEEYRAVMDVMELFRDHMDLEYIYVVRHEEGKLFTFIIDSALVAPAYFGEQVEYTDALYRASLGVADVDGDPYEDRWGRFYSSYSPVFDSGGNVAGIVGVDFRADWYDDQVAQHTKTVLLFDALALVLGMSIIFFIGRKISRSFQSLSAELGNLGSDVDVLTREVALSLGLDKAEADNSAVELIAKPSGGDISDLGDKISSMQETLRKYIVYLRAQAYADVMTGVGNKAAYLDTVKSLGLDADGAAVFSIAVFDINGLKNVNDSLGHEYGDYLIVDTASALKRVFGKDCVFRIGGDEFIAVLEGMSAKDVARLFAELDRDIEAFNAGEKRYAAPLALSKGAATYLPEQDGGYNDVFRRADEAMYADKAAYYKTHGDRRRSR